MLLSLTYRGLWFLFDDTNARDDSATGAGLSALLSMMPTADDGFAWFLPSVTAPLPTDRTAGAMSAAHAAADTTASSASEEAAAMPAVAASDATPVPGFSPLLKGFNFVADIDGSYQDTAQVASSLADMIASTNSNAVALTEDYGINAETSTVYADYSTDTTTGNTETLDALAATIQQAEADGLSVMVRPLIDFTADATSAQLTAPDGTVYHDTEWRASYVPDDPTAFFNSYDAMIVAQAQVAQANGAQIFCIGTELDQLTGPDNLTEWTQIINDVKKVFFGKLTYSAISDDDLGYWSFQGGGASPGTGDITTQVSFWSQLDYVGIDEYAAIADNPNPTLQQLIDGWTQTPTDPTTDKQTGGESLIQYYEGVAAQIGKPLLFTELGYNSAPDAASQPFYTSDPGQADYDPQLQALLYQAFIDAWQQAGNTSLEGVYLWNWEPDPSSVGAGTDPSWTPQGNAGALQVLASGFGAACYVAGTAIAAPGGARPIEDFAIGDLVLTASGAVRPVRWVGRRSYAARFVAGSAAIQPILIRAGAIADSVPARDLRVSPRHAMFLDGVLAPAHFLLNGRSIVRDTTPRDVHYVHLELDSHDVLLAEGAPSESFVDCDSRRLFQNAHDYDALYPDDDGDRAECAERAEDGPVLAELRRRLAWRAGLCADHVGDAATHGALEGWIDETTGSCVRGWAWDPTRPHTPVRLRILVDGNPVGETVANQARSDLRDAGKGAGRCAFTFAFPMPLAHTRRWQVLVQRRDDDVAVPGGPVCFVPAETQLDGCIDHCTPTEMDGWAFDAATSDAPVPLEILVDGEVIGAAVADRFRRDLLQAGKGRGCCGFVYRFDRPLGSNRRVEIRRVGDFGTIAAA